MSRPDRQIAPARAKTSRGIPLSARNDDSSEMPFAFTRLTATTRGEVYMSTRTKRSQNAFTDLEAQLRALGDSGNRLAEATTSLRASARIFAAASARLSASAPRIRDRRPMLKLL